MKIQILKDKIVTNEATFYSAEEMSSWLELHKDMGSFGQDYEVIVLDESAKIIQEAKNTEALKYLADTDYLVIRSIEDSSKPVSDEIKQLRAEARLKVVR